MSPLGLGTDLAISVRGPAAHTGIVSLKATHGRVPMTGIWPREPRRFWHVGPMARSIRDLSLAFSQLAGPDGQDGYSSNAISFDNGIGSSNKRPLRVGWLVEPVAPRYGVSILISRLVGVIDRTKSALKIQSSFALWGHARRRLQLMGSADFSLWGHDSPQAADCTMNPVSHYGATTECGLHHKLKLLTP